ncbi:MAG: DUF1571 domain-containing protein [Thermoguttaceae bacterium]
MFRRKRMSWCRLPLLLACTVWTLPLLAQTAPGAPGAGPGAAAAPAGGDSQSSVYTRPVRVAERTEVLAPPADSGLRPGDPHEHPLMPALRWARQGLNQIEKIHDYSATLVKRERLGNRLGEYEHMFIKVRHQPFSVYMYFLAPSAKKGQEVIYVAGANNGKMWAHGVGIQDTIFGTVSLEPEGVVAMQGERYPLTELGILNLTHRLVQVAEQDTKYGECEVKFFKGAKINDRVCTCVQVMHPRPRRNFLFHLARIYVDDQFNVPVRYEAYEWPRRPNGKPELIEEYTYLNLKLNNGFTDADFDTHNKDYHFR